MKTYIVNRAGLRMHTHIVLNAVRGRSNVIRRRINTNEDQEKTFYLKKS